MANTVDEKVVAMQFDNQQFEQNVGTTLSTLDKLKSSLKFDNVKRGFEQLESASRLVTLGPLGQAVEAVAHRFSTLGVLAAGVLANISSRAVDAGINLVKSLSLGQVMGGFQEYETNMTSIQTILANTASSGATLEDVNKALDILNEYSDQTIYNFGEMARNIGTFTAAGIDLDTSVAAIKGIANLAAISGSNSGQAATAMYQLSQALASGTVKLMDWNSVVNAGMGGEVFQKALWESGRALGTLTDIPIGQTFEQWKDSGNSFRASLESGWITADVLTNTLQGFTGDLTDAQLLSMGYTEAQIVEIQKMGKVGKEAATKVKTFTQLMSTMKESIGSGWSASFRLIIGDFEEARTMFTDFNSAISTVVTRSADARNKLLQGWKDLGGRTVLIEGITAAFKALGSIVSVVKSAFHNVFPPATSKTLYDLTVRFTNFMKALDLRGSANFGALKTFFTGLFSVLKIGVEVVKGVAHVFSAFFDQLGSVKDLGGASGIFVFLKKIGSFFISLRENLVDSGKIEAFFNQLANYAKPVADIFSNLIGFLLGVKDAIISLFAGDKISASDKFGEAVSRLNERFQPLANSFGRLGDGLKWIFDKIGLTTDALKRFANFLKDTFAKIPQALADVFAKTDYDLALDTVNTGLFAGLVLLFKKFLSGDIDFGNGLLEKIGDAFTALTGTLEAMQAKVKSEAILKIAQALALLTVSLVVLSMMDSAALTKSLIAISAGMAILMAGLVAMNKLVVGGVKLGIIAASIVALSAALLILSLAVKVFSTMDPVELAKGLGAITYTLQLMINVLDQLSGNYEDIIKASLAMGLMAVAMNIMALAVKAFSTMSLGELAKGLGSVTVAMVVLVQALNKMPDQKSFIAIGIGLIAIGVALNLIAAAVKIFSTMSWEELGKGLGAIAVAMAVLVIALNKMPTKLAMASTGAGILLIGLGLVAMSKAITMLGSLSWSALAKGLIGIAGALVLLVAAVKVIEKSATGAFALSVMAGSMLLMAHAVKQFAGLSWPDLIKGLIGLGGALFLMVSAATATTAAIPAMLGLGAAILLIGGGIALVGLGASLFATAIAVLVTAGTEGLKTFAGALAVLIDHIPAALEAVGAGLVRLVNQFLDALPGMITNLSSSLTAFLQLIIDNTPKFVELFVTMIRGALQAIRDTTPEIIATGFEVLMSFLNGILNNIEQITTTVINIIVKFLETIAAHMGEIVAAGLDVLVQFLKGIADNIGLVLEAATSIVTEFISGIGAMASEIVAAGTKALVDFLGGIAAAIPQIATAVTEIFTTLLEEIAKQVPLVVDAFFQMFIDLFNGLADVIRKRSGELGKALGNLVSALVEGIGNALKEAIKEIANDLFPGLGYVVTGILDFFGIASPSKLFYWIGEQLMLGFKNGIDDNFHKPEESLGSGSVKMVDTMGDTMAKIASIMQQDIDMNPTITPVLDLTSVTAGAATLQKLLDRNSVIGAEISIGKANQIASNDTTITQTANDPVQVIKEVKFEQNNYSPTALSAAEIYRQTRNQIAIAKEELYAA